MTPSRSVPCLVAFALAAAASTAAAEPKPQSPIGVAVDQVPGLLNRSTSSTIQILQTPHASHWGNAAFDVSPVCGVARSIWSRAKADPDCDPVLHLRDCTKDNRCDAGLTCRNLAVLRDPNKKVCAGHTDELVDKVYTYVSQAETHVDLTSLYPYEGRYLTAIGRGLSDAARGGKKLRVRLLYGADQTGAYYFGAYTNPKTYLADLVGALDADLGGGELTIHAATPLRRTGTLSWNHAKMIGVDGKRAIVTGFNLKESHYLNERPVHDLGVAVEGHAALAVHTFANALWGACNDWVYTWSTARKKLAADSCPAAFDVKTDDAAEGARAYVAGVPRKGSLDDGKDANRQPSDRVLLTMIQQASRQGVAIKISQQRMTNGPGAWAYWQNTRVMDQIRKALALALIRDVPVHVVVSGTAVDKPPTANGYESEDPTRFIMKVRAHLKAELLAASDKELAALLPAMRTERRLSDERTEPQVPRALTPENVELLKLRGLDGVADPYEAKRKQLVEIAKAIDTYLESVHQPSEYEREQYLSDHATSQRLRQEIDELVDAAALGIKPTETYVKACKLLTVKTVDFVNRPSPAYRPANHAKLLMVDDQAYYVGSHNMYESDLDEFGYFVDDQQAAGTLNQDYWTPLWTYSKEFLGAPPCDQ